MLGVVLLLFSPHAVRASSSDVAPAHTGGFGEMTCQQCHWENPVNEPSGRLTIEGLPDSYTPGEQYLITVALARPGLGRAGFQLSAREDGINMNAGSNAGTLTSMDKATTVVMEKAITYIQHTRVGSEAKDGKAAWKFSWTAPDDQRPVVFPVAANAANDDASPLGDFIYTATAKTR